MSNVDKILTVENVLYMYEQGYIIVANDGKLGEFVKEDEGGAYESN